MENNVNLSSIISIIYFLLYSLIYCDEPPPGTLTDLNLCKVSHLGIDYKGYIGKTESNVRCQSWTSSQPHIIKEDIADRNFSDGSKKLAKNFCRNPTSDPMGPWCYTIDTDLQYETCGLPLCSFSQVNIDKYVF
ncbi:plasminogen-like [Diorhabda carinulata]|uniref:plasminogen-like n=1 Tax=Diorhabda carinulata TaxID=1163345 RepID=UPI0025A006AB|nr:plasminogen-like [Diorhabda carinulata]